MRRFKREKDTGKTDQINRDLADLQEQYTTLSTRWSREKELIQDIQGMKQAIETARNQADKAERQGNYEKVAELRYGTINKLEKDLAETQRKLTEMQGNDAMLKEEVYADEIADIVSRWTGIPVKKKMLQGERQKTPPARRRTP